MSSRVSVIGIREKEREIRIAIVHLGNGNSLNVPNLQNVEELISPVARSQIYVKNASQSSFFLWYLLNVSNSRTNISQKIILQLHFILLIMQLEIFTIAEAQKILAMKQTKKNLIRLKQFWNLILSLIKKNRLKLHGHTQNSSY